MRRRSSQSRPKRSSLKRQLTWILLVIVALALGYVVGTLLRDDEPQSSRVTAVLEEPAATGEPTPWYRSQPPPPKMITVADAPIFPEVDEGEIIGPRRAYEESLPDEVYRPVVPREPPIEPVPRRPSPPEDLVAWKRYAVPAPPVDSAPRIAIVIDDLGIDRKRTQQVIGFPGPLTLSFLTYAKDLPEQTRQAREAGHELLLHVGMEPAGTVVDPGPNVLRIQDDQDELLKRLRWGLDRFPAYVGINNHMGSRFTADRAGMTVVMAELKRQGLIFLDSRTTAESVGETTAQELGVPFATRNIFLDNVNEVEAVRERLREVESFARTHGSVIAIGHPRDATIRAMSDWLTQLQERGVRLVPLTALVRLPEAAG